MSELNNPDIPGFNKRENLIADVIVKGLMKATGERLADLTDQINRRNDRTALVIKHMDQRITEAKSLAAANQRALDASRKRQQSLRSILIKSITARLVAAAAKKHADPVEIASAIYGPGRVIEAVKDLSAFMAKAATDPAMTTVAGWAAELVGQANYPGLLATIAPQSVYASLKSRGTSVSLSGGSMRFPSRAVPGTVPNPFVGEGQPIPVRVISLTSGGLLQPFKAACISLFSGELGRSSTPSIEAVLRQALAEDIAASIDGVLLGSAAGSPTQPPGLLYGVTGLPPSTATDLASAAAEDLSALAAAIPSAGSLVYLLNSAQVVAASLLVPGSAGLDFIVSDSVPAGTVVAIDASDFIATADQGGIDVAEDASLITRDDPLPVSTGVSGAASPHQSLYQVDCVGVRLIEDVSWSLRADGRVAFVTPTSW